MLIKYKNKLKSLPADTHAMSLSMIQIYTEKGSGVNHIICLSFLQ